MYLNKKDWNQLDDLLGKHGFGGYYDLVESLKICLGNLGFAETGICVEDIKTLPDVVQILNYWTSKIGHTKEFDNLVEMIINANKED